MAQAQVTYPATSLLSVVMVIAISAVAATGIAAWLVNQVARRAIDKTTPEGVPPTLVALAALLSPLRLFLPWSGQSGPWQPRLPAAGPGQTSADNETSSDASPEAGHDS